MGTKSNKSCSETRCYLAKSTHYQPVDVVGVLELDDTLEATDKVGEIPVEDMTSVTTVIPSKLGGSVTWNSLIVTRSSTSGVP